MKVRLWASSAMALALAAAISGSAIADKESDVVAAPVSADNFRLVDNTGFAQELRRLVDVKAIVVVSQANGDKRSRAAAKSLEAIKAANPGVEFLMLNSSLADGRNEIMAEAKAQGYSIPVLDDDNQLVGEQLGVSYVGEAFVIQPKTLKVLYHGPVDAAGAKKKAKGYLAAALADVTAGKPVAVSYVTGKGTAVAFPERKRIAQHAAISYSKDVAPILEAKCVTCHQTGGIGPFAMSDYDMVKGFAPMIREAIRTDTMPPWHPDPTVGKFAHDQSLTQDQIKTIVHWVEAGAPRGEGPDPLAAVQRTAPVWPLGQAGPGARHSDLYDPRLGRGAVPVSGRRQPADRRALGEGGDADAGRPARRAPHPCRLHLRHAADRARIGRAVGSELWRIRRRRRIVQRA